MAPVGTAPSVRRDPASGLARPRRIPPETTLDEYLKLLDWTGRQIRTGKRGRIDDSLPPILKRLDLGCGQPEPGAGDAAGKAELFCTMVAEFETLFSDAVGSLGSLLERVGKLGERAVTSVTTRFGQAGRTDDG